MAIKFAPNYQEYVCLSTDDKSALTENNTIVYYTDTKVRQIYNGVSWIDYVLNVDTSEYNFATVGSKTTIVDSKKNFETDMLKDSIAEVEIDGISYLRAVTGNTYNTITINALPGAKATANIGAGADGVVTATVAEEGNVDYVIEVVNGIENGDLSADFANDKITVTLGMGIGDKATATIGEGANGTVGIEVDTAGAVGNNYTVAVIDDISEQDVALSSALVGTDLTVVLGTVGDVSAIASIGSVENGIIDVVVDAVGSNGNDYTITVNTSAVSDANLSVALNASDITITLGNDLLEVSATKNTATLITAAINLLEGFTATAQGTGEGSIMIAEAVKSFAGGTNKLSDTANTATLVTASINLIVGLTATASGTGETPLLLGLAETSFTGGGLNPVVDDLKSTATLVAGVINTLEDFTAVKSGTGDDVIFVTVEPVAFTGGVDTVVVRIGDKYRINDKYSNIALLKALVTP